MMYWRKRDMNTASLFQLFSVRILVFVNLVCSKTLGISSNDEMFMARAIDLAAQANGRTSPNPCVGCVIVDQAGKIVGEGYHAKAGQSHAEVLALNAAGNQTINATAYVTLEPCNHYGRTPPCSLALVRHGISRVVAGMVDPDPRVSGKGIQFLKSNGVSVETGVKEKECRDLNAPFVHRILTKKPFAICWVSFDPVKSLITQDICSTPHIHLVPEIDTIIISSVDFVSDDWAHRLKDIPQHITVVIVAHNQTQATFCRNNDIKIKLNEIRSPYHHSSCNDGFEVVSDRLRRHEPSQKIFFATLEESYKPQYAFVDNSNLDEEDHELSTTCIDDKSRVLFAAVRQSVHLGSNAALVVVNSCLPSLRSLCRFGYIQKLVISAQFDEVNAIRSTDVTCINNGGQYANDNHQSVVDAIKDLVRDDVDTIATAKARLLAGGGQGGVPLPSANSFDIRRLRVSQIFSQVPKSFTPSPLVKPHLTKSKLVNTAAPLQDFVGGIETSGAGSTVEHSSKPPRGALYQYALWKLRSPGE